MFQYSSTLLFKCFVYRFDIILPIFSFLILLLRKKKREGEERRKSLNKKKGGEDLERALTILDTKQNASGVYSMRTANDVALGKTAPSKEYLLVYKYIYKRIFSLKKEREEK